MQGTRGDSAESAWGGGRGSAVHRIVCRSGRTGHRLAVGWRAGLQQGGCRLISLALTAKLAGIDVEVDLKDVLSRVDKTPASEIASLTPWAWAAAQQD